MAVPETQCGILSERPEGKKLIMYFLETEYGNCSR
jgi:hypothetical protein